MKMILRLRRCIFMAAILMTLGSGAAMSQDQAAPWQPRCVSEGRTAPAQCSLSYGVFMRETQRLLFGLSFSVGSEGGPVSFNVTGPLGFNLPDGIIVALDDSPVLTLQVQSCDTQGCHATSELSGDTLDLLLAASAMTLLYTPEIGQQRSVPVPLTGLSDGMSAIR